MGKARIKSRGFKLNTYKRTCDRSGLDFTRAELVRDGQTGLLVHPDYYYPKNTFDLPFIPPKERTFIE